LRPRGPPAPWPLVAPGPVRHRRFNRGSRRRRGGAASLRVSPIEAGTPDHRQIPVGFFIGLLKKGAGQEGGPS